MSGTADDIDVIARETAHVVGAEAAIQHVDAGIAGDDVVEGVSRAVECPCRAASVLDRAARRLF